MDKGYQVTGTSRDAQIIPFGNLYRLGIRERVKVASMVLTDFRSVLQTLAKAEPDEIYNLAGQSSVGLSFEQPVETLESIATGTINLLEAMRFLDRNIKLYNAGSLPPAEISDSAAMPARPIRSLTGARRYVCPRSCTR